MVFDLDGTLVDTVAGITDAVNVALCRHGLLELATWETQAQVGLGGFSLVRSAALKSGVLPDEELLAELQRDYLDAYAADPGRHAVVYPGAAELLKRLRTAGVRVSLCTNKSGRITHGLLAALGLDTAFDAVVSGDTFPYRKPDPRHFLDAVTHAGGTSGLMVGDSISDVRAARAAGAPVLCVSFGYGSRAELAPDGWLDHFADFSAVASEVLVRETLLGDL